MTTPVRLQNVSHTTQSPGVMPSLTALTAHCVVQAASASDDAQSVWAPHIAALGDVQQDLLVEAGARMLQNTTDALIALRLGRCLPQGRVALWRCMPAAQALTQTPLWALLQTPLATAVWVDALGVASAEIGSLSARTTLQTRLTLFLSLCTQGGFAPEAGLDIALMQRQLQGILRFFFPQDDYDDRWRISEPYRQLFRLPPGVRIDPLAPRFDPPYPQPFLNLGPRPRPRFWPFDDGLTEL